MKIHFGPAACWELPHDERIASLAGPSEFVPGIALAVDAALSQPLDFPSLDQAIVPDDKVVLAIDPAIPSLPEVVSETAKWLRDRGTDPLNMRIVIGGDGIPATGELSTALHATLGCSVPVEIHDPDDPKRLAYVAANTAADPIYMNRSLVDADVVIPISCARPQSALDYFGGYSLYPLLCDRETRGKFYSLPRLDNATAHAELRAWADQAAWWIGILVGIQVVPAGENRLTAIIAGQLDALESACQQAMTDAWNTPAGHAELIVALLDGQLSQQSWLGIARILHNAQKCVAPRGTIVLGSQLSVAVGKGLSRLRNAHQSAKSVASKLAVDSCDDAIAAAVILQATASHHVYLISKLPSETIESLGLGVISHPEQLTRLIQQHGSCTILGSAQHRSLELCPS